MTEIDPRLRTELGHRAGQIDVTGDFATRAIEIETRAQKRRVATAAIGSALALAVTAPLVYSAMTPEATQPVPATSSTAPVPTTSAPAPTQNPTAIPTFDTGAEPLATALPKLGPATGTPDVPYAVDGLLHDGDREIPLPLKTNIWSLARLDHGGVLGHGDTETGTRWFLLDSRGKELASLAAYQSVVANEDGSRLLVATTDGSLRVLDSRGGALQQMKSAYTPLAMLGDLAFVQSTDGSDSMVWNTVTGETRTIKGTVRDVNVQRNIALVLEPQVVPNSSEVCYSIVDVDTLNTASRACGPIAPVAFSPKGTYVLGTGTFDGGGPMSLAVVRVDDGRVALEVDDSVGSWSARMNEAETGVTFSASESGPATPTNNALVRCDLSGACTVVGDARRMSMVAGQPAAVWTVPQS
jgi:hypothetical protein